MQVQFLVILTLASESISQLETPHDGALAIQPYPPRQNLDYGSKAVYQCEPLNVTDYISWTILFRNNGTECNALDKLHLGIGVQDHPHRLHVSITENGINTNITVICKIVYGDRSDYISDHRATIFVQGPLQRVTNLRYQVSEQEQIVNITWTPPPTLDINNRDIDIYYCVNVTNSIRDFESSECNIETNYYSLNFSGRGFTPCDSASVMVTPFNGYHRNIAGAQQNITIHFFEGVRSFSAGDVEVTATELSPTLMSFSLTLPIGETSTCSQYCRITAPNLLCSNDHGLHCNGNMIEFNVSITNTCFQLKRIYNVNIVVGNSAGTTHSTGSLVISTHSIQGVDIIHTDGSSTLQLNITFAQNSSVRGVQVTLLPPHLSEVTCDNFIRYNSEKRNSDFIIQDIPRGQYNIVVYVIEREGLPGTNAVPVNHPPRVIHVDHDASDFNRAPQSTAINARRVDNTLITEYGPVSDNTAEQFVGTLTGDTNLAKYEVLEFPSDETSTEHTLSEDISYCLSVYTQYENESFSPYPVKNIYIPDSTSSGGGERNNDWITKYLAPTISVLAVICGPGYSI